MDLKDNPLLQPEDFLAGYRESMEKLKHDPTLISFDKLCYEVFTSEIGKKFMEVALERYVIPPLADRNSPNFRTNAVWAEGFKDVFRMIRSCIVSHEQRIKAENSR